MTFKCTGATISNKQSFNFRVQPSTKLIVRISLYSYLTVKRIPFITVICIKLGFEDRRIVSIKEVVIEE